MLSVIDNNVRYDGRALIHMGFDTAPAISSQRNTVRFIIRPSGCTRCMKLKGALVQTARTVLLQPPFPLPNMFHTCSEFNPFFTMIQKGSSQNEILPATCLCAKTVQKQKNAVVVWYTVFKKKKNTSQTSIPIAVLCWWCDGGR